MHTPPPYFPHDFKQFAFLHRKRSRLARIPSPRHSVHCRIWVPCRRAEPFFPLSTCRQCWTTHPLVLRNVHPPRRGVGPNVIIRSPSPHFEWQSRWFLFDSFLAVLFVGQNVYNTVVLGARDRSGSDTCAPIFKIRDQTQGTDKARV